MRGRKISGVPVTSIYTRVYSHVEWIQRTAWRVTARYYSPNQDHMRSLEEERDRLLRSPFGLLGQYLEPPKR